MTVEVELKLDFEPDELARFRKWSKLRDMSKGPIKRACLRAIYFDTEDLILAKQRASIRIRREFGKWMQTVKLSMPSGDIRQRLEFNTEIPEATLHLNAVKANVNLPDYFKSLEVSDYKEIFRTRIWRTVRQLEFNGSQIELAIDHGYIYANGDQTLVSEAELELIDGEKDHLSELADSWKESFTFKGNGRSKASRGFELALGERARERLAGLIDG